LTFQDVAFENSGLILPGEAFAKKQGFMTSTILKQGALLIFCYAVAVSLLIYQCGLGHLIKKVRPCCSNRIRP
jgi:hypothetical protein